MSSSKNYVQVIILKNKFIDTEFKVSIPRDFTSIELSRRVRKCVSVNEYQSVFLLHKNKILTNTNIMGPFYDLYKDKDGFLRLELIVESTSDR